MNAPLPKHLSTCRHLIHPLKLDVTSSACLTTPSGEEIWCQTDSLSRKELVVTCSLEELMTLIPRGCMTPDMKLHIEVCLYLPQGGQDAPALLQCPMSVRSTRRVAKDRFLVNLSFLDLSLNQWTLLESFIDRRKPKRSMTPA